MLLPARQTEFAVRTYKRQKDDMKKPQDFPPRPEIKYIF
jgi:hypothetical protein